jgi:hypothetical protein
LIDTQFTGKHLSKTCLEGYRARFLSNFFLRKIYDLKQNCFWGIFSFCVAVFCNCCVFNSLQNMQLRALLNALVFTCIIYDLNNKLEKICRKKNFGLRFMSTVCENLDFCPKILSPKWVKLQFLVEIRIFSINNCITQN